MGNSTSSDTYYPKAKTTGQWVPIPRTISYCPIFGLPRHTAILFSEPAWHYTNPIHLPLFGNYIVEPKMKQIASHFTNDDLLIYTQTITKLYKNDQVGRPNTSLVVPTVHEHLPYSVTYDLNGLPPFHTHAEEIHHDTLPTNNDMNESSMLITLPLSRQATHKTSYVYDTITTPLYELKTRHFYYHHCYYHFPTISHYDSRPYRYQHDVQIKSFVANTSLKLPVLPHKDDEQFYTNFLPLKTTTIIRSIWPWNGFSFKSVLLKDQEEFCGQNLPIFPFIIIMLDLLDINSREEFSLCLSTIIQLRLESFLYNLDDIKLFIFIDPTHLDAILHTTTRSTTTTPTTTTISEPLLFDSSTLETITTTPSISATTPTSTPTTIPHHGPFTSLDPFIRYDSQIPKFDFSSQIYTVEEMINICTLVGFKEENVFINYVSLTSSQFPRDEIVPQQFFPTVYKPSPLLEAIPTLTSLVVKLTNDERDQKIQQERQSVEKSTLDIITSIIRPHIVTIPTLSQYEFDLIDKSLHPRPPSSIINQTNSKPYSLYLHPPLLPYQLQSLQQLPIESIYKLQLLNVQGVIESCQLAPIGFYESPRHVLSSGPRVKLHWPEKFVKEFFASRILQEKYQTITITNDDIYTANIHGTPRINYQHTFNIPTLPSTTSLTIPLHIRSITTNIYDKLCQNTCLFAIELIPYQYNHFQVDNHLVSNLFPKQHSQSYSQRMMQLPVLTTHPTPNTIISMPIHIIIVSLTALPTDDDYESKFQQEVQNSLYRDDKLYPSRLTCEKLEIIKTNIFDSYKRLLCGLCGTRFGSSGDQIFQELFHFHFVGLDQLDQLIIQIQKHALRERLNIILETIKAKQ